MYNDKDKTYICDICETKSKARKAPPNWTIPFGWFQLKQQNITMYCCGRACMETAKIIINKEKARLELLRGPGKNPRYPYPAPLD